MGDDDRSHSNLNHRERREADDILMEPWHSKVELSTSPLCDTVGDSRR